MAYITTEAVKEIRNELKKEFPNIKFSVVRENYSAIQVAIMESDLEFEKEYMQLNHYHLHTYPNAEILKKICEISNRNNFDNSEPMTDYFHVGYYFSLSVGKWDRPYKCTKK